MPTISVTVDAVTKSVTVSDADMTRLTAWMTSAYSGSPNQMMMPGMIIPSPGATPLTADQAVAAWLNDWMANTTNRQINAERQAVAPISVSAPA